MNLQILKYLTDMLETEGGQLLAPSVMVDRREVIINVKIRKTVLGISERSFTNFPGDEDMETALRIMKQVMERYKEVEGI